MRGFKLDPITHDLVLQEGDLVEIDGIEAAAQEIKTRLRLWLGEYFLDLSAGFPYLQLVFKKNPNLFLVRERMARVIESVDGIQPGAVVTTTLDNATRSLRIVFSATYREGSTVRGTLTQGAETLPTTTYLITSSGDFLVTSSGDFLIAS